MSNKSMRIAQRKAQPRSVSGVGWSVELGFVLSFMNDIKKLFDNFWV
ncbi:MAG: hypothetical protein HOP34_00925 [Methylococcaceae bacterium]|nr:hypothetical protein [Methylococcaceae bacterium]